MKIYSWIIKYVSGPWKLKGLIITQCDSPGMVVLLVSAVCIYKQEGSVGSNLAREIYKHHIYTHPHYNPIL